MLGHDLMSRWEALFAGFRLPKYCDAEGNTEPKRNIVRVSQNGFSPNVWRPVYGQTLRSLDTARSVPDPTWKKLAFAARLDVLVKPFSGFGDGRDMVWFAIPYAFHRNQQEYRGGQPEKPAADRAVGDCFDHFK